QRVETEAAPGGAPEPLGDQKRAVLVGLGQQHPELLAADAARRGDAARPLRHVLADLLEGLVSVAVAALGVDAAHAVDLADDDRERTPRAPRAVELEVEHL